MALKPSALAVVLAIVSDVLATSQTSRLRITLPDAETVLSGIALFAVEASPTDTPIVEVTFYVDGAEACRSRVAPFRCSADTGVGVSSRHVRAVALFKDGARATAATRTKGIDVAEAVSVDAVVVSAHVTDYRGRFVRDLQRHDFRVFEDGTAQEITSFAATGGALELVVALDVSMSMAPMFDALKRAVIQFLHALRPDDTVTLAGFNTGLFVAAPRSATTEAREAAVRKMRAWGGTSLYDAMIRACDLLKLPATRRALVVFTDGEDVSSRGSSEAARMALQARDAVLYVVGQGRAMEDRVLRQRLEILAAETGGAAFFGNKASDLDEHFDTIVENLANQYVFGYTPRLALGDGQWREIRVELTGKRYKVRARQGYFASRPSLGQRQ